MTLFSADLYCGAGGLTEGLSQAIEQLQRQRPELALDHIAINHWDVAIDTHKLNHPWARHKNKDIELVKPWDVVPGGHLHFLGAAPPCQGYAKAAGRKPRNEQQRAHPWNITHWITSLRRVDNVLIENVPEWRDWGPLDDRGHRIPEQKGLYFDAFLATLRDLGYAVDHRVLNSADYGDPTTRKRLFVIARRDHRPVWPEPTHASKANGLPRWRPAREIIDWTDTGHSIWTRGVPETDQAHKKPLAQTTMRRIAEGLRRYSHPDLEPFADAIANLTPERVRLMQNTAIDPADITPELVAHACDPFLVKYYGTSTATPIHEPLDTVTGQGVKFALCCPFLIGQHGGSVARSINDPCMSVAGGGAISITNPHPFVLPPNGIHGGTRRTNRARDPDHEPLQTITASRGGGHLVNGWLVPFFGERNGQDPRTHALHDPLPAVTGHGAGGLATAYLIQYHGQSHARSVQEPMGAVTSRDRFALVVPELHPIALDIHFRMLKFRELARAMGFPDSYRFAGNKTERTRQVGNAIPVGTTRALCWTLLTDRTPLVAPAEPRNGFQGTDHRERAEQLAQTRTNGHVQDTIRGDAS